MRNILMLITSVRVKTYKNADSRQVFLIVVSFQASSASCIYNHGNKLSGQLRKTALYLTPQAI